jgi:phosphate starvation-inducible protein PhoH
MKSSSNNTLQISVRAKERLGAVIKNPGQPDEDVIDLKIEQFVEKQLGYKIAYSSPDDQGRVILTFVPSVDKPPVPPLDVKNLINALVKKSVLVTEEQRAQFVEQQRTNIHAELMKSPHVKEVRFKDNPQGDAQGYFRAELIFVEARPLAAVERLAGRETSQATIRLGRLDKTEPLTLDDVFKVADKHGLLEQYTTFLEVPLPEWAQNRNKKDEKAVPDPMAGLFFLPHEVVAHYNAAVTGKPVESDNEVWDIINRGEFEFWRNVIEAARTVGYNLSLAYIPAKRKAVSGDPFECLQGIESDIRGLEEECIGADDDKRREIERRIANLRKPETDIAPSQISIPKAREIADKASKRETDLTHPVLLLIPIDGYDHNLDQQRTGLTKAMQGIAGQVFGGSHGRGRLDQTREFLSAWGHYQTDLANYETLPDGERSKKEAPKKPTYLMRDLKYLLERISLKTATKGSARPKQIIGEDEFADVDEAKGQALLERVRRAAEEYGKLIRQKVPVPIEDPAHFASVKGVLGHLRQKLGISKSSITAVDNASGCFVFVDRGLEEELQIRIVKIINHLVFTAQNKARHAQGQTAQTLQEADVSHAIQHVEDQEKARMAFVPAARQAVNRTVSDSDVPISLAPATIVLLRDENLKETVREYHEKLAPFAITNAGVRFLQELDERRTSLAGKFFEALNTIGTSGIPGLTRAHLREAWAAAEDAAEIIRGRPWSQPPEPISTTTDEKDSDVPGVTVEGLKSIRLYAPFPRDPRNAEADLQFINGTLSYTGNTILVQFLFPRPVQKELEDYYSGLGISLEGNGKVRLWGPADRVRKAAQAIVKYVALAQECSETLPKLEPVQLIKVALDKTKLPKPRTAEDIAREGKIPTVLRGITLPEFYPRSYNQYLADEAVRRTPFVFIIGTAGTGKTFQAIRHATEMLCEGLVERMILARYISATHQRIGAVPGDQIRKIMKENRPFTDKLVKLLSSDGDKAKATGTLSKLIRDVSSEFGGNTIDFLLPTDAPGVSVEDAALIVDEGQNMRTADMLQFMRRAGENTQVIILGSFEQMTPGPIFDVGYEEPNGCGLAFFVNLLKENPEMKEYATIIHLNDPEEDVQRSPVQRRLEAALERVKYAQPPWLEEIKNSLGEIANLHSLGGERTIIEQRKGSGEFLVPRPIYPRNAWAEKTIFPPEEARRYLPLEGPRLVYAAG